MDTSLIIISFLAGFVTHRILIGIYDLGQIGLYIREVEKNALVMLASVAESVAYIQQIKLNTMKDLKLPENTIKKTRNIDNYNFDAWKNAAVSNLLSAYPEKYKNHARYVDWRSAMVFLDKIYKKNRPEL